MILTGVAIYQSTRDKPQTIKVAFVAREVLDKTRTLNQKTDHAFRHYLRELERERPEWRFEVDIFFVDDDNTATVWEGISRDASYALVVDNAWGENMMQAAGIIKRDALPVIALNADKLTADPGNQALFLGHADPYPEYVTAFVKDILGHDTVQFVTEKRYRLKDYFIAEFKERGIDYGEPIELDGEASTLDIQGVLDSVVRHPDVPVVLNTHYKWGEGILNVAESDSAVRGVTFVGPPAVISGANMDDFGGGGSGNEFYMIADPVDALTHKVTTDLRRFKRETSFWEDSTSDPEYVKRCLDAVEIIRYALDFDGKREDEESEDRRKRIASALGALIKDRLPGQDDLYVFDEGGRVVHEATFVHHANGTKQSYPLQLNSSFQPIDNIVVGIELLDVSDLDPEANSFKADFLYWTVEPKKMRDEFRGDDKLALETAEDGDSGIDISPIFFPNLKQEFSQRLLLERRGGSFEEDRHLHYRRYQVSGEFHHSFALGDFPLDEQEPALQIGIVNPSDRLRISFDQSMLGQYSKDASVQSVVIPGWNATRAPYATVENRVTADLLGDPSLARAQAYKFKTLSFWIPMKRSWLSQFFVIVLPLVAIGVISLFLLFSPNVAYETIGDLAVGVFLSIITYSIAYTQLTPASNVLTKADHLFYGTFLTVMAAFAWIIFSNILYKADVLRSRGVGRPFKAVRLGLVLAYTVWVVLIPGL